ncbi:glycan-binding surface protein [Foetidibacter luteolus]|uniref:glycan-binding surface protein n=1 Tax=Foetidibacter luteolus TaxID=2608880 RepID=UPI00129A1602|nr:glycan-binding surface protein [Foetidibacter luteolus]
MIQHNLTFTGRRGIQMLCAILLGILLFSACKKDSVSGPPIIQQVSLLDSSKLDSTFTKALPGTQILITGQNLNDIVNVYFNNAAAYFNPTLSTSTHLIVEIPSNAPTEATNPDVPNAIRIVTTHGEASFSFVIDIPPPSIESVSNENALPGDSVIIWGSSLWLIDKIVLPGNREITDFNADDKGWRVGFVMPDLGSDTGRLVIHAKYGTAMSNGPLNDHESGDVISNLTGDWESGEKSIFNWAWWGANRTNDAALFPGTRGAYLQNVFGGVGSNDGGWWNGNRSGNFNDVPLFTAAIMSEPAANYGLKFEINTKEAWKGGICVIRLKGDGGYAFRYMPWQGTTDKVFNTDGKWTTVTIPLSDFKKAEGGVEGTGAGASSMGDVLNAGGVVSFGYRFISEDDPIDLFNAAFDNFRIVKIK